MLHLAVYDLFQKYLKQILISSLNSQQIDEIKIVFQYSGLNWSVVDRVILFTFLKENIFNDV